MPGIQVVDATGQGKGPGAAVTNNMLHTMAVNCPVVANTSKTGYTFLIASDFISLTTTGSFNGLIYIKNEDTNRNLFIDKVRTCSDATGTVQVRKILNPTAGTLISDANSADQLSANAGLSGVGFNGKAYAASGDGKTVTDGSNWTQYINKSPGHSIQEYSGAIIIPNGQSMAIVAKPSVATTICVEVQCWFEDI